ncbi:MULTISPECIES: ATP-dependent RecD-like DNA helicase [Clostridium]|uniref:ATP-dependent RecD2 DNA helicase n=1 Tax=Clostridium cibarium TaxID=2762247 RepID=A0ABR8PXP8_9CLOT|nr:MULTISPECIES: ATP-dependent RecD-like DNA helicase [Clostridium]MBD7912950.1 ATP-dependent RecD-like DNA helicase [Clostridium cibarium]
MDVVEGFIEGIVFKSEDTGYVVVKVNSNNKTVTAVGTVPFLREGQHVKLTGSWKVHKQFGEQFSITKCEEIVPDTIDGIEKYLSSGIIRGIGPVTAKKIIEHFGEDTIDVLDNNINRLKEIEGIGDKKFSIICESYLEQHDLKDIMIYFQGQGISHGQCLKIYKKFGPNAKEIVQKNPYILCKEIKGIGFLTADKLAESIGIDRESDSRIKSGIDFIINRFCSSGNTYMPKKLVIEETKELIRVKEELIEENIYNASLENQLIIQKINNVEAVFIPVYYYSELGITEKIAKLSLENYQTINTDIEFEIEVFEKKQEIRLAASQKEAIIGAFTDGIEIITGGPGTGKTTIIKSIIDIYENQGMKVLLAAPTGRAAKRMSESTGREAKTIHRLLDIGAGEENTDIGNDSYEPLDGDVVIIDEASMIDIFLMNNLLKAIRLGTRLIVVGDVDQLPSVGAGNVLKDLINSGLIKVVRLKEIFRQGAESLIITNAHRINQGEMPLLNRKDKDFYFIKEDNMESILQVLLDLINRRLPNFNRNWDKRKDIQVLTPMKKGILGVLNLNEKLQEILNPPSKEKKEKKQRNLILREGDKVMQTKNNYSIKWSLLSEGESIEGEGVFNGDMGFIKSISEDGRTLTVVFDDEKKVVYDSESTEELELAYAITIHKSQGSEFKVVIIPAFMGSPFLMNRNLLYTGITRAKELLTVVGYSRALQYMVTNTESMERYSTLELRIKDLLCNDALS